MKNSSNKPGYIAYSVRDYENSQGDADSTWTRIGVAWKHEDGDGFNGFNITLEAFPISGRIVLRKNKPKAQA